MKKNILTISIILVLVLMSIILLNTGNNSIDENSISGDFELIILNHPTTIDNSIGEVYSRENPYATSCSKS